MVSPVRLFGSTARGANITDAHTSAPKRRTNVRHGKSYQDITNKATFTFSHHCFKLTLLARRLLAEREGFEPSVRLHVHTLSRRAP